MSKWFRGAGDDDSDEESQKSSTEESEENSNSESDDSSKSSKSDSESGEEAESDDEKKKQEQESKEKRARFLKGRDDSSDNESDTDKTKQSGREKRRQEMISCVKQIREKLQADECSGATDFLEKIRNLAVKAIKMEGWTVPPRPFFLAILIIEAYAKQFEDEDAREGMTAQHVKELRELRNKAKKHASQFAAATDAYRKRLGEDFNWEDELDDDEEDEDDIEGDDLPDISRKETDKEKEKDKIWDTEFAEKKLNEVLAVRGKKGTDREEQVKELTRIFNHTLATELALRTRIRIHLLSAYLDMTPPQSSFLPREAWQNAYNTLITLLESLHENPHVVLAESEIEEGMDEKVHSINDGKLAELSIQIVGNFVGYAQRLDDEFIKALQFTDPHTGDFVKILQDEAFLMDALERTLQYYVLRKMMKHAARISSRLLAHLYYRRQDAHVQMLTKQRLIAERAKKRTQEAAQADYEAVQGEAQKDSAASPKEDESGKKKSRLDRLERRRREFSVTDDVTECMQRFLPIVLKHNEEKARIKATLENVYHLALHNKYTQARDQLLMSHVGDYINGTSINPVFCIAYNRALAQLGLAAFRLGLFRDVHTCLNELCSTQKTKELLAQGLPAQRYNEVRKPEQERADKMRLIPYHMHINLDSLEAAHLVAALIVEVPTLAANPHSKPKIQSKGFNKLLNHYQQQVFLGPPENVRDHVYAAYRAMLEGDWGRCSDLVCSIPAWDLVHGHADIKTMLTRRIKDEALRSYLLQYSQFYETISLAVLAEKFDMPANTVHAVVSKMMFNSELSGSWNQPASCIQIHKNTPNKLQYLALQTAEKAQQLVEYNEKMVEYKTGTGGFSQYSKGDGTRQGGRSSEWGGMNRWPFAGQRRVNVGGGGGGGGGRGGGQQQQRHHQGGYSGGQGGGGGNSGNRNNNNNDGNRNPFQFRSRNQQQRQQAGGFSSAAGRSATYAQAGQRLGAREA